MHRRPRLNPPLAAVGGALLAVLVTGCAGAVDVDAAPHATDQGCAEVMATLRGAGYDDLAGRQRRETDAQATAAWGDPPVVLRCGVEPPGPTTDPCLHVDGVDWVVRETDEAALFTTYGRWPALEVSLPVEDRSGSDAVLAAVGGLAQRLPQDRQCL